MICLLKSVGMLQKKYDLTLSRGNSNDGVPAMALRQSVYHLSGCPQELCREYAKITRLYDLALKVGAPLWIMIQQV